MTTAPEQPEGGTPPLRPERPWPAWVRPLPVRLAFVVLPVVWAAVEAYFGDWNWAVMVALLAAWGAWTLILRPKGL